MENIPIELRAVVSLSVNGLKELEAPTSIGYNDMAIMIAFGESREMGIPTVSAEMISEYLGRHPAVPDDARMQPDKVQGYLDILHEYSLIEEGNDAGSYKMRSDMSSCIVRDYERLKSPDIDDLLFHGFRLYCAHAIDRERRQDDFL
jgi:hypothetical protein